MASTDSGIVECVAFAKLSAGSVDQRISAEASQAVIRIAATTGLASGEALRTATQGIKVVSVLAVAYRNRACAIDQSVSSITGSTICKRNAGLATGLADHACLVHLGKA